MPYKQIISSMNNMNIMNKHFYNFDTAPYSTHTLLLNEIPAGEKVLEIGSASGYLGEYLIREKKCEVWGLEPDNDFYSRALNKEYKELLNNTVEEFLTIDKYPKEYFDSILIGDVLEHLADPNSILAGLKKYLKPDGKIIISLPNIASYKIRISLLFGNFQMQDAGILDRTHLHFYTYRSAREMIESAGLKITKSLPANGQFERFGINKLMGVGQKCLYLFPRLWAEQFIFVCKLK